MPTLIGGELCLDFVNTVDPRHVPNRREYLDSYPALVAWGRHTETIDDADGERLLQTGAADPGAAQDALRRAIRLREALYRIVAQATRRRAPARGDLDLLNHELNSAMARTRVAWSPQGFSWEWDDTRPWLDRILWPVTRSAADLLVRGPLERVRECPGAGNCGWLFFDVSKNARRRWCEMRSCGNRAKARRHHARARAGMQV
jgi:predicted RNA-binding Zn ribbon-like protein